MRRKPARPARAWHVAIFMILCGACASIASAQQDDEGPIVIGEQRQLRGLQLTHIDAAIEGFYRRETEKNDPADGESITDVENLYREILELSTTGFFGHPNFIDIEASVGLQLSQEDLDFESMQQDDSDAENIYEFDISTQILKEGPAPLTLYGRRDQRLVDRQFGESLDSTLTEYGARLRIRSDLAPTRFNIFRREQTQESQLGSADFELNQNTFEWQTQLNIGNNQVATWDYSFDDIEESGELRTPNSFERHDATLTHIINFGPEESHRLHSRLNYFRETGLFAIERWRLDESLDLHHSETFQTRFDYTLDSQDRDEFEQDLQRAVAGFQHRLFESLVTTGEIGWTRLEQPSSDFKSDEFFGNLNLDYTKKVPYGRLTLTTSLNLSRQENSDRGAPIQIIDESRTFDQSGQIFIQRRNIIIDSIVITDVSGLFVFTQGVDYTVQSFGDIVEIELIPGGDISLGQTVLIDYQVAPEPGDTTTTTGLGFTARYDIDEGFLNGVGLYTRIFQQEQDRSGISSAVGAGGIGPTILPDSDFTDLVYGIDYDLGDLYLLAEQRNRDSSISPFDSTRLEARYTSYLGRDSSLVLSGTYTTIDRTDDNIETTLTTLTGRWNQRFSDNLHASLAVIWRDEQDSVGSDSEAFEQNLDVTWRYRQTTVYATLRNTFVNSDVNDRSFQAIQVGLRREF